MGGLPARLSLGSPVLRARIASILAAPCSFTRKSHRGVRAAAHKMLRLFCAFSSAAGPQLSHISSTSNAAVKHCVKLRQSGSYRRQMGSVLLVGEDLVLETAGKADIRALIAVEGRPQMPDVAARRHVTVTAPVMAKLAGLESVSPATLAAEAALPDAPDLLGWPVGQLSRVLVLDGVQDPGNLGTLLRTALALGWQAAVLLPGCCDAFNDKALKASRGAPFRLPVVPYSHEQFVDLLAAQQLLALAAKPDRTGGDEARQQAVAAAGSLVDVQQRLSQLRLCLVVGAEGQGISPAVLQHCRPVSIPQAPGAMESLNAAVAGACLMQALSPAGSAPLLAELAGL